MIRFLFISFIFLVVINPSHTVMINQNFLLWSKNIYFTSDEKSESICESPGNFSHSNRPSGFHNAFSCSFGNDDIFVFGGKGYGSDIAYAGLLNDLWEYDIINDMWRFLHGTKLRNQNGYYKGAPQLITPGGSHLGSMICYEDHRTQEKSLYILGGIGYDEINPDHRLLNDLWKYEISINQWTHINGNGTGNSNWNQLFDAPDIWNNKYLYGGIAEYVILSYPQKNIFVTMGGDISSNDINILCNAIVLYNLTSHESKFLWITTHKQLHYDIGNPRFYDASNYISERQGHTGWIVRDDEFYIYGGKGYDSTGIICSLGDLWMFNIKIIQWKFLSGYYACVIGRVPQYGTISYKFNAELNEFPLERIYASSFMYDFEIYIYGGETINGIRLNDMVKYNIIQDEWYYIYGYEFPIAKFLLSKYSYEYSYENVIGQRNGPIVKHFIKNNELNVIIASGYGGCEWSPQIYLADMFVMKHVKICNDRFEFEDEACNYGTCVYNNECKCYENYYGKSCSISRCGNIFSNSSNEILCNGRGECINGRCKCYGNVLGNECEIPICHGEPSNSSTVCSGIENGWCGFDTNGKTKCFCHYGYEGEFCGSRNGIISMTTDIWHIYLLILFFICLIICICIIIIITTAYIISKQRKTLKKIGEIEDLDLVLKEQKISREEGNISFKFTNKKIFIINEKDIKLIEWIARGASIASIFKAKWKGKIVAVKVASITHSSQIQTNEESLMEFEKEIALLESLKFAHIIQYYGCLYKSNKLGYVMEYCSKSSIGNYLKHYRKLHKKAIDIKVKIRFLKEISMAMSFLHSKGIIHRDLKPQNILISESNEIRVSDFGLSKIFRSTNKTMTKCIGTSSYMPPEMTLGLPYDFSADVFSYGITMFEILTEKSPYHHLHDQVGVEFAVAKNRHFRPLIENEVGIPKALKLIMQMCWNHDAKSRPSFDKIRKMIENCEKTLNKQEHLVVLYVKKRNEKDENLEDCILSEISMKGLYELIEKKSDGAHNIKVFWRIENEKEIHIQNDEDVKKLKDDCILIYECDEDVIMKIKKLKMENEKLKVLLKNQRMTFNKELQSLQHKKELQ